MAQLILDVALVGLKGKYDEMKVLPIRFCLMMVLLLTPYFSENVLRNPVFSELNSSIACLFVV